MLRNLYPQTDGKYWRVAIPSLDIGSSLLDIGYSKFYTTTTYVK